MPKPRNRLDVRNVWISRPCLQCGAQAGDRCRMPCGSATYPHVTRRHDDGGGNCVKQCRYCAAARLERLRLGEPELWEALVSYATEPRVRFVERPDGSWGPVQLG